MSQGANVRYRIKDALPSSAYQHIEANGTLVVVLPFEKRFDFKPGHCAVFWYTGM